jgi:hypothetical protein
MMSDDLQFFVTQAGAKSCQMLRNFLEDSLTSYPYDRGESGVSRQLCNLYLRGLLTNAERLLLEQVVHLCDVIDQSDNPQQSEALLAAICSRLRGEQASPTAAAIAAIIHSWKEDCAWWPPIDELFSLDDQHAVNFDDCDVNHLMPSVVRAAIMGAYNAPPDPLQAVNGAIAEVAISFLQDRGLDWVNHRRSQWLIETLTLVSSIGDGCYVDTFLAHFNLEELKEARRWAFGEEAEHIDSYLKAQNELFASPAEGIRYTRVHWMLDCPDHESILASLEDHNLYYLDELLEGLYSAVRNACNEGATAIVDFINTWCYPFDRYMELAGECNHQLQTQLRKHDCDYPEAGVDSGWDYNVCKWNSSMMTVTRFDHLVMWVTNRAADVERITVMNRALASALAEKGLAIEANGKLSFPLNAAEFGSFLDTIINAISALDRDQVTLPPMEGAEDPATFVASWESEPSRSDDIADDVEDIVLDDEDFPMANEAALKEPGDDDDDYFIDESDVASPPPEDDR